MECTSVPVYQPSLPVILNLVGAAQRPAPGAAVSPAGPGRARTGPEPASSLRRRSILGMVEILCPIPGIPRPTTHNCNSVIFSASLTHHTDISGVSSHAGDFKLKRNIRNNSDDRVRRVVSYLVILARN